MLSHILLLSGKLVVQLLSPHSSSKLIKANFLIAEVTYFFNAQSDKNQCISSVFQIQFACPFCAIGKPEAILRNNTMQYSESSSDWISLGQEEVSTWATCPFKGSSVCM